jgi:hypothetical protein
MDTIRFTLETCPTHELDDQSQFSATIDELIDAEFVVECEYCNHLCNPLIENVRQYKLLQSAIQANWRKK